MTSAVTEAHQRGAAGVLAYVEGEIAAGRPFPSHEAIAVAIGRHSSSVAAALFRLALVGRIVEVGRVPRSRGWRRSYELPTTRGE